MVETMEICNSGKILIFELPWWHFVLLSFYVFCKSGVFLLKTKLILKTENSMFFPKFFSDFFLFWGGKIPKVCHKNKSMHVNINNSLLGGVILISIARFKNK